MKKTILTLAMLIGLGMGAYAQTGGLFDLGPSAGSGSDSYTPDRADGGLLSLPTQHGDSGDASAPLGTGTLLLLGFGAAYALKKRSKE